MAWTLYRLMNLVFLIAAASIGLAALTGRLGLPFWAMLATAGLVAAFSNPPSKVEWAAIVLIAVLLMSLLIPATCHSHHPRRKPAPATTTRS